MVSASDSLAVQWQNPADFLSVVLLIGPDVIQRAIAQMAGRAITPVAFSFGWVTYAVSALLSSFGGACPNFPISRWRNFHHICLYAGRWPPDARHRRDSYCD